MPAYLLVYYNVTNSEQFKKYLEAVGPLIHKRGGRMIAEGLPMSWMGHFLGSVQWYLNGPHEKMLLILGIPMSIKR